MDRKFYKIVILTNFVLDMASFGGELSSPLGKGMF